MDRLATFALNRLNASAPVDISTISFNVRPPRVAKLDNIVLGQDSLNLHRKISCTMDDILVFELGCSEDESSGSCDIEWWQAHKEIESAVYMIQRSTVQLYFPRIRVIETKHLVYLTG